MTNRRVLFVEDDQGQQLLFKKAVDAWNTEHGDRQFELFTAADVASAHASLDLHRFDCALFDLKLPAGEGKRRGDGSDLAVAGLTQYGIPVGILSGHPEDVDREVTKHGLVQVFDKLEEDGDPYGRAVAWFGDQWPLMETLAGSRSEIRRSGAEIFLGRVWPQWQQYQDLKGVKSEDVVRIVARQYVSHIAEHLGLNLTGDLGWHPFEHYIQPALQEQKAQTGDIFRIDAALWVVLTPACDMATGKAPSILLVRCREKTAGKRDPLSYWDGRVAELSNKSLDEEQQKERDGYFLSLVNQATPGKHFLPPLSGGRPMFVEFKDIRTVPSADLKLDDRVASIAPAFLSNLVQRFGAYISRTGQPDIEIRHFA